MSGFTDVCGKDWPISYYKTFFLIINNAIKYIPMYMPCTYLYFMVFVKVVNLQRWNFLAEIGPHILRLFR